MQLHIEHEFEIIRKTAKNISPIQLINVPFVAVYVESPVMKETRFANINPDRSFGFLVQANPTIASYRYYSALGGCRQLEVRASRDRHSIAPNTEN